MSSDLLPADAELQFKRLLDSFPARDDSERSYIEIAKARGWKTFQHLPPGTGSEILLDVGSMNGLYAPAYVNLWNYKQVYLIGTDAPPEGRVARIASDGTSFSFPSANCNIELTRWPFDDGTFDTVVCTEVLEHMIFDPLFVANEISRVLKPGGLALISVPNAASDTCLTFLLNDMQPGYLRQYISDALKSGRRDLDTVYNLGHFHEYTQPELEGLVKAAGFEIKLITGVSPKPPHHQSLRFRGLRKLVRLLFPHSRRIPEDLLVSVLRKVHYTPVDQLSDRYPSPLYRPLNPA